MLYRKNKNGRYEGVTAKGQVVRFEDADEMLAAVELRREFNRLTGGSEAITFDYTVKELFEKEEKPKRINFGEKRIKLRIHKGEYTVSGKKLIKKALA